MNKEDYKAIAKILRECWLLFLNSKSRLAVINSFADYFEREDKKEFMEKCDKVGVHKLLKFNREQFKGWCGVKND